MAFYEAVAQLIPLLLVLFVLETRVFRGLATDPTNPRAGKLALAGGFMALNVIIGEVTCLRVLQTEEADRADAWLAWTSLFNICAYIVAVWLLGVRQELRRRLRDEQRPGASV